MQDVPWVLQAAGVAGGLLPNLIDVGQSMYQHHTDLQWSEVDYFLQVRQLFVDILNNIREDVQDVHEKDERQLDTNLLVATLMLGFGFGFSVEGTFPSDVRSSFWQVHLRVIYAGVAACSLVLPFLATVGLLECRRRLDVFMRMFNEKFNMKLTKANKLQTYALRSAGVMEDFSRGSTQGLPTTLVGSLLRRSPIRCCSRRRVPIRRMRAQQFGQPFLRPVSSSAVLDMFNQAVQQVCDPIAHLGTPLLSLSRGWAQRERDGFRRSATMREIKMSDPELRKQVTGNRVITGHWSITPPTPTDLEALLADERYTNAVEQIVQHIWKEQLRNMRRAAATVPDVSVSVAFWTGSTVDVTYTIDIDRFNDSFNVKISYLQWRYVHVDWLGKYSSRLLIAGIVINVVSAALLLGLYFQSKYPDTPAAWIVYSGVVSLGILLFAVFYGTLLLRMPTFQGCGMGGFDDDTCRWATEGGLPQWARVEDNW